MKLPLVAVVVLAASRGALGDEHLPRLTAKGYFNEFRVMPGHTKKQHVFAAQPHMETDIKDLPKTMSWQNVDGVSYLTKNLNQHIPQVVVLLLTTTASCYC